MQSNVIRDRGGIHVTRNEPKLSEQQLAELPEPTPGSGLGMCVKCRGDLCVSNGLVVCDRCGMPHKHQINQAPPPPPPAAEVMEVFIEQNAGSVLDRLVRLERRVAALEALLAGDPDPPAGPPAEPPPGPGPPGATPPGSPGPPSARPPTPPATPGRRRA